MGFFRRTSSAAATAESTTDAEQPKPQPYRHIPVHAASDSMTNGAQNSGTHFDRQRIEAESRRRMKLAAVNEPNAGDMAYLQAMARGALPRTPSYSSYGAVTPRGGMSRSGSGYFTPSMPYIADTDEDPMASHTSKLSPDMVHTPHWASDSGYGSATPSSAIHSRTPSEHGKLESEHADAMNRRAGSDASGSVEAGTEPELSEASSDDTPVEIPLKKTQRGVLKVRRASPTLEDDPNSDARSIRSVRSTRSTSKQTRFEQQHSEAVPPVPQQHREEFARQESRRQNRERVLRTPSPGKMDDTQRPPLSTLEGFKVNSKGQVLNEEGEWVGELVEGDLLDCVRQRVGTNGRVLDAAGNFVGRVRVVARSSEKRPNMSPVFEDQGSLQRNDSADLLAYKGEIPPGDATAAYATYMHTRGMSLNGRVVPPPFSRHATTGMLALNSSQLGPAAGRRSIPYAVGVPTGRPTIGSRHSYAGSARRSAPVSQEHSPVGPTEGMDSLPDLSGEPISRTVSVRTTASSQTLQPKQRTYFTHAGRVVVDSNEVMANHSVETLEAKPEKTTEDAKSTKRKSRFSGMFHKKK